MTAAAKAPSSEYLEDGVTTNFGAPFRYLAAGHLSVQRISLLGSVSTLALGTDYAATAGDSDAGGVVTIAAPVAGGRLRIRRVTPRAQQTDYTTTDTFPAESHEQALDKLTLIVQEQDVAREDLAARAVRAPDGEVLAELPPKAARIGLVPRFGVAGDLELINPDIFGKGDPGGNVMAVGLYQQVLGLPVPAGTDVIRTSGYALVGKGGGFYVADALATAGLAAAHPMFCTVTGNARYFRALADDEGLVAVAMGGVIGTGLPDHTTNHQPGIKAAIEYARAIGAAGVRFDKAYYSVWTPFCTRATRLGDLTLNETGFPFVFKGNLEMRAAAGGTTLMRRKFDGSDPAVFAGTQLLADGGYFRGGMFVFYGPAAEPANYDDRPTLTLRGKLTLDGGLDQSGAHNYTGPPTAVPYMINPDGSGWDVTDKPIFIGAQGFAGDFICDGDVTIKRFRGELIYQGGTQIGSIYVRGNLLLSDTDGDGFNPGPGSSRDTPGYGVLRIENLHIRRAFQGMEGASGNGLSWFKNLVIEDCKGTSGGGAGGIFAGVYPQYTIDSTFAALTATPKLEIGKVRVERSVSYQLYNDTHVSSLVTVDGRFEFGNSLLPGINCLVDHATVIADRSNVNPGVLFNGYGVAGTFNCRVGHLTGAQTSYAKANGNFVLKPADWGGSLGPTNWIDRITGMFYSPSTASNYATVTAYSINFGQVDVEAFTGATTQNVETTPVLSYHYGHDIGLQSTTNAGIFPVTLLSGTGKLSKGARLRVTNFMSVACFAVQKTNTYLQARVILRPGKQALFEWDNSGWKLVTPPDMLFAGGTYNLQKGGAAIPAGDVSDEVTITIAGADPGVGGSPGMRVSVQDTTAGGHADQFLFGRVSAADTVKFRAKNMSLAGTLALGPRNYNITLDYAN